MGKGTLQAPVSWLLLCLAVALTIAASMLAGNHARPQGGPDIRPLSPLSGHQPRDDAGDVARHFVEAFNVVDYRDSGRWLDSLRPLATDRVLVMLEAVYVPMSWPLFERDRLVITRDVVRTEDKGVVADGRDWQARLVGVTVLPVPQGGGSAAIEMRVLLTRVKGEWKVASLLSEAESARLADVAAESQR